jgi:biopolymer transport protein ExbB/TolQ
MRTTMSDAAIRAALDAAAMRLCICDGECFETRHGMMHGPCERRTGKTAAAVAAFLRHMAATSESELDAEMFLEIEADMAAAATDEIEMSRQAGLSVTGDHLDNAMGRATAAVAAVQSGLAKRLSGGQQFLASVGSTGPFVGLFGTVYGIMNSFIGIVQSNTTNLAAVAPGIAEALLATGIGLFAAIPAVVFYNYFNTRIAAYGTRADGFAAELLNGISRQLDKGA